MTRQDNLEPIRMNVIEISDSEDELPTETSLVWFLCTNIPDIGYIQGTRYDNHFVSVKMSNIGVIERVNPKIAMMKING